jgi:hypothetical protein
MNRAHRSSQYQKVTFFRTIGESGWTRTPYEQQRFAYAKSSAVGPQHRLCSIGDSINRELAERLFVLFGDSVRALHGYGYWTCSLDKDLDMNHSTENSSESLITLSTMNAVHVWRSLCLVRV